MLAAGCGGGSGGTLSDADAITKALKDAAKAAAGGDGDTACGLLTLEAQRQAILQLGAGPLGQTDCSQAVGRAHFALSPLEKKEVDAMEPTNIRVNGASASATLATGVGAPPGQAMSIQLNLQKVGSEWKVSGFVNAQGIPGQ